MRSDPARDQSLASSLIYQDTNILVLSKPSGLTVNRSQTESGHTLQDEIEQKYGIGVEKDETDFTQRSGIVHRLDKDTSGIILVAKNPNTFEYLQVQFKDRLVKKEYIALVFGEVKDAIFEVNAPIKRSSRNRLKYAVVKDGKDAKTVVHRLNSFENSTAEQLKLTYLRVLPMTGRTHQIRVHLLALGHPVVGDILYSSRNQVKKAETMGFNRLMLHAYKIEFTQLGTDKWMEFTDPLPKAFAGCIIV